MEPTGGSADAVRGGATVLRSYGGCEWRVAMREAAWAAFTSAPEAGLAGTNSGSPYEPCSRLTITVERLPSASIFSSNSSGMRIATSVVGIVIHLYRLLYTFVYVRHVFWYIAPRDTVEMVHIPAHLREKSVYALISM